MKGISGLDFREFLSGMEVREELYLEFVVVFSRFEYAMKCAGLLKNPSGRAEPSWQQLAADLQPHFYQEPTPKLLEAWNYLTLNPPKKQCVKNSSVGWEEFVMACPPGVAVGFDCICQVRNNLFHGGKYLAPEGDVERDKKLLESSLVVLGECLRVAKQHLPRFHEAFVLTLPR